MSKCLPLEQSDQLIRSVLDHIEDLYSPQPTLENKLQPALKSLYDHTRSIEPSKFSAPNSSATLFTQGFSDVQIWEQLKVPIDHITSLATKKQAEWLTKSIEEICLPPVSESESEIEEDMDMEDEDDMDFDEDGEFDEDFSDQDGDFSALRQKIGPQQPNNNKSLQNQQNSKQQKNLPKKSHEADDGFFSYDEMEKFANEGELYGQEGYKNDDQIDLFDSSIWENNDDEEDNEGFASYADFFGTDGPQEFADDEQRDFDDISDSELFGLNAMGGEGEFDELDAFGRFGGFGEGEMDDFQDDFDDMFGNGSSKSKRSRNLDDIDDDGDDLANDGDDFFTKGGKNAKNQKNNANKQDDEKNFMQIDDSDAVMDHLLSPYEERRDKLAAQIAALETEISGPKRWEMRGESSGHHREKDALMDHDVEFDQAMRIATPITHEIALEFEQIIKARIRDNAFDDVQPRATLTGSLQSQTVEKKDDIVSSAKPKFGLAEQYEREYQQIATGIDQDSVQLQKKYQEISSLFAIVANQLDALSNYHYTAKAKVNELTVTDSVDVVQKEEVMSASHNPTMAASASNLTTITSVAPQELYAAKSAGLEANRAELSVEERQRAIKRRKEKKSQHFAHKDEDLQQAAKAGHAGAKKKVEQKQLSKDYEKFSKSGKITVDASMQKGANKSAPQHNYGSMSGVVASMSHNEKQQQMTRKAKLAKTAGTAAPTAKALFQ